MRYLNLTNNPPEKLHIGQVVKDGDTESPYVVTRVTNEHTGVTPLGELDPNLEYTEDLPKEENENKGSWKNIYS
jgi:hypothetical protein